MASCRHNLETNELYFDCNEWFMHVLEEILRWHWDELTITAKESRSHSYPHTARPYSSIYPTCIESHVSMWFLCNSIALGGKFWEYDHVYCHWINKEMYPFAAQCRICLIRCTKCAMYVLDFSLRNNSVLTIGMQLNSHEHTHAHSQRNK